MSRSLLGSALPALLVVATSLHAGVITQVNTRGALPQEDSVQWGIPADEGTGKSSPYAVASVSGITVTASLPQGFLIFIQGSSYGGDFASNDIVLETDWTAGPVSGPLSITFSELISGVGFQIQRSILFEDFTGVMRAYDDSDLQMGSDITINSTSGTGGDGSAPFLGLGSSLVDIRRIEVEVSNSSGDLDNSFAINYASLRLDAVGIPEPATLALLFLGLAGLGFSRRRKR